MSTDHERDDELLRAYAEVAERRSRRITELVVELEDLRRERGGARRSLERQVARLEVENARLREDLRAGAAPDRGRRPLPLRAARRLRRTLRARVRR